MLLWGILQRITRGFGLSSGGDRNGPGCKEEWKTGREMCEEQFLKQGRDLGVTGGYEDVENCARGIVSEACGGNEVEYPDEDQSQRGRRPRRRGRGSR